MRKILILKGIPASGKSTYAKQFVKDNEGWVRVCKDDIRLLYGLPFSWRFEKLVRIAEVNLVHQALNQDYNVVVDSTNLKPRDLTKWNTIATEVNAEIEVKFFEVSLEEAIKRDSLRECTVGKEVVTTFYNQYYELSNNQGSGEA